MSTAASVIASAAVPAGRIEGSRFVPGPRAKLPPRELGVGQFTVRQSAGRVELLDPHQVPCGVFASEQLAWATARVLSQ